MDLNQQFIEEFKEGLDASNVMVLLWDPKDRLVYAGQKSFDWSEAAGGNSALTSLLPIMKRL